MHKRHELLFNTFIDFSHCIENISMRERGVNNKSDQETGEFWICLSLTKNLQDCARIYNAFCQNLDL